MNRAVKRSSIPREDSVLESGKGTKEMPTVRKGIIVGGMSGFGGLLEQREPELSKQVPVCEVKEGEHVRYPVTGACPRPGPILVSYSSSLLSYPHSRSPDSLPSSFPDIHPPILSLSSHSHSFSLAKVRGPFTLLFPPLPSALLPGRRFFISNHPIAVRPHRLIKGHSLKVSSFTPPPITHVTEPYDCIQRGFAPSSWLRATLAVIYHHHF